MPAPTDASTGAEPPEDVEALMAALLAAGGRVVAEEPTPAVRARWRRLLFAAQGHPAVPEGSRLRHRGRSHGDLVVWLESEEAAPAAAPAPVPIPDHVRRPHPAIAAIRTAKAGEGGWLDTVREPGVAHVRVHRTQRARTMLLLHALCTEAERRGYEVTVDTSADRERRSKRARCGLTLVVDGHPFEIAVVEETDRVPHEPTRREVEQAERYSWIRVPEWDRVPSGRLSLRLGHDSYATQLASDRRRWRLEERLGHALAKVEAAAAAATERDRAAAQRREEEQQQLQKAVAAATTEWQQERLRTDLAERANQFRRAQEIRDLVEAARSAADVDADWLAWAEAEADRIDPTVGGRLT